MSYTFCTSQAIVVKAGANISSSVVSNAVIQRACDNAEGYVNVATRYDWITNSGAIGTNFKPLIADTISSLAAIDLIEYDMESIGKSEAINRINILYDRATAGVELLKKIKRPEVEY